MRVVIFGSTGMVGAGVLLECLDDARVNPVLTTNPVFTRDPRSRWPILTHN